MHHWLDYVIVFNKLHEFAMKNFILFILVLFVSFASPAQNTDLPKIIAPPVPPIIIKSNKKTDKAIEVAQFKVQSKIYGNLAQTIIDISFHNPNNRTISADFIFPIPANSTLNGYALDVNGIMVDGVAVEKHKARVTFEKIVRQGVDPGLVEKIQGNVFKTRIFPLNANANRKIRIKYITVLAKNKQTYSYQIPLIQGQKVGEFKLNIQAFDTASKPIITSEQFNDLEFSQWNNAYVTEVSKKDFSLEKPLTIQVPKLNSNNVIIAKNNSNEVYFSINQNSINVPRFEVEHHNSPKSIKLIWDASNSRYALDHQLEINFLNSYFNQNKHVKVELYLLRNKLAKQKTFIVMHGNWGELKQTLKAINYDGATNLSALNKLRGKSDAVLLFTDSIHTFNDRQKIKLNSPLYVVSSGLAINQSYASMLAEENNGQSLQLTAQSDMKQLVNALFLPNKQLISIDVLLGKVRKLPDLSRTLSNNPRQISGQLLSKKAELRLNYGYNLKISNSVKITLNKDKALETNLPELIWAQQQLDYLQKDGKQNKARIIGLSQQYDLVSDFTSLIVLENLAQYVEHKIAPPKSLSKMRSDYFTQIKASKKDKEKTVHDKIAQVINMWQTRKQWWEKEFPKYVAPKPNKSRQRFDSQHSEEELDRVTVTGSQMALGAFPVEESHRESPSPVTMQAEMKKEKAVDSTNASVQISEWNPDTPYLKTLEKAKDKTISYYELKKDYHQSPAFYFDASNYFFKNDNQDFALQVLSNIAELKIQDSRLLRTMAMALKQHELFDISIWAYSKVLAERSEEPQSYRDLALALQQRIDAGKAKSIKQDYKQAIELLYKVVTDKWDRFQGIEVTVLMEINQILPKIDKYHIDYSFIDKRLIQLLDVDLRITLAWDSDMTDIDLWVIEPSGEKVTYSKTLSTVGGMFHQDFTGGYGPEEYLLHKAPLGNYTIKVHFYGNGSPELTGGTTLYVDVFTNFGRSNQKRQTLSLRLEKAEDDFLVGTIAID